MLPTSCVPGWKPARHGRVLLPIAIAVPGDGQAIPLLVAEVLTPPSAAPAPTAQGRNESDAGIGDNAVSPPGGVRRRPPNQVNAASGVRAVRSRGHHQDWRLSNVLSIESIVEPTGRSQVVGPARDAVPTGECVQGSASGRRRGDRCSSRQLGRVDNCTRQRNVVRANDDASVPVLLTDAPTGLAYHR